MEKQKFVIVRSTYKYVNAEPVCTSMEIVSKIELDMEEFKYYTELLQVTNNMYKKGKSKGKFSRYSIMLDPHEIKDFKFFDNVNILCKSINLKDLDNDDKNNGLNSMEILICDNFMTKKFMKELCNDDSEEHMKEFGYFYNRKTRYTTNTYMIFFNVPVKGLLKKMPYKHLIHRMKLITIIQLNNIWEEVGSETPIEILVNTEMSKVVNPVFDYYNILMDKGE